MIVSAIAAMGANRVIGQEGDLPWNIPEDMKFFREKTKARIVIMGRKTFESFPEGRPLPGRYHIVITRQSSWAQEVASRLNLLRKQKEFVKGTEVTVVSSITEALHEANLKTAFYGEEVFVIGGGEIYQQMLPQTQRIYLTEIHKNFNGDAYFPNFEASDFREVARISRPGEVPFDFVTYERHIL
jgi:dihydrofolate reductase